jgi:hypothetical protein
MSQSDIDTQEFEVQENYSLDKYDYYNDQFNKLNRCKSQQVLKGNTPSSALTHLSKQQERSSRESKNRGGKTELRRNARLKIVLGNPIELEEPEEVKAKEQITVKPIRVVLKRVRRKVGHRQAWTEKN